MPASDRKSGRLVAVELDWASLVPGLSFVVHERAATIHDLTDNELTPRGIGAAACRLRVSIRDRKLLFEIAGEAAARHLPSLAPLNRVIRDYFPVCDSCYAKAGSTHPARIEAIDMDRRRLP
jgi:uncharacterized protein (UPF0262 family)